MQGVWEEDEEDEGTAVSENYSEQAYICMCVLAMSIRVWQRTMICSRTQDWVGPTQLWVFTCCLSVSKSDFFSTRQMHHHCAIHGVILGTRMQQMSAEDELGAGGLALARHCTA